MVNNKRDIRTHFDLNSLPFTREVPVDKLWRPDRFKEHLDDLIDVVHERMSAAVIAPAGAGKTALLRALADSLPEARFRVHYVKVTRLSGRDFCREVASAVGCEPAGYYGSLVRKIQERSLALMDQDALRPVLILDESHDMRPEVLAILRVLTNFSMDSRLVVSIIIAGQPPLREMLRREDLEAVSRRLAHYASPRLLTREETRQYIQHRLDIAGSDNGVFDDQALEALYEVGKGNLRATDRVALKAMQCACRQGDPVVGQDHVANARQQVSP
jgi:type II secretory pathway predicted ATPase ExeA